MRSVIGSSVIGLALLTVGLHAADAADEPPEKPDQGAAGLTISDDCFEELNLGTKPHIGCRVPLRLSDVERAELEKGSRGYVKDVTCDLTVLISRTLIETAISSRDVTFQSPDQPVTCTITTPKSTFDVTATFAPHVVIKNDTAVEASPGLGNVQGVSRVISWPVIAFVNRWPSIRSGMLQVVNAYRLHARKQKPHLNPSTPPGPPPAARTK